MLAHLQSAFMTLMHFDLLMICFGSVILGLLMGAIPGLSGGIAMIILLPVTFTMTPVYSIAMLCSIHIGSQSGGYLGSVLLGIPGTNGSVATVYDGYELTKKGQAVRALSVCALANFFGAIPGIIIAMFLCTWLAIYAVRMGPWEMFAVTMTGITMIVTLSEKNLLKGFLAAGIGLLVACFGMSPMSGTPRFHFGIHYLYGGFDRANVILGIFAGRTIFLEYVRGERMGRTFEKIKMSFFKLQKGDFKDNIGNIIRSFGIGAWIGFLPGLGDNVANVVAYGAAKKASKDPESFGKGNISGVWAPELASNACIGGAIIPTIALGLPGSSNMVFLMMALVMGGIDPGPLLMHSNPEVVYMIYGSLIIGAVGILLFQIFGIPLLPLMLRIPYHYLYPAIIVLCFVGAFAIVGNLFSVVVFILFTLLGVWFSYAKLPHTCFILALILGSIIEGNFRHAMSMSPETGWMSFFMRPVSCIFLILLMVMLFYPLMKKAYLAIRAKS